MRFERVDQAHQRPEHFSFDAADVRQRLDAVPCITTAHRISEQHAPQTERPPRLELGFREFKV